MKENNLQPRLLYPARISFKYEGEIKSFSDKQKLREFCIYAVRSDCRGMHIGEKLVLDCLAKAKEHGFGVLQFNAVVEGNVHARHLYERFGFTQLGTIPHGFRMRDGSFANICPYCKELA